MKQTQCVELQQEMELSNTLPFLPNGWWKQRYGLDSQRSKDVEFVCMDERDIQVNAVVTAVTRL